MPIRYFIVLALLFFSAGSWAGAGRWQLGGDVPLAVLEDSGGTLGAEQVAALPDSAFRTLPAGLAAGYSGSAFWLKVYTPRDARGEELLLEIGPPYLDDVVLYEPDGNGWRIHASGDLQPYAQREVGYRHFVLRLAPADSSRPLLLRVRSTSALNLHGSFWQPAAFATTVIPESLLSGAYFGVAGLSILLALSYGMWLRSRLFMVYALALTLATMLIAAVNGFHAQWLFPHAPLAASLFTGILVFLTQAGQLWLLAELLETEWYFPRYRRVLLIAAALMALASLSAFSGHYRYLAAPVLAITWLFLVSAALASLVLVRRHVAGSRIVLAAIVIHVAALLPNLLMLLALIPPGWLPLYGWQAEILLHMLLLHAAMLWRLRKSDERQRRQLDEALAVSREAGRQLDARVAERTHDLGVVRNRLEYALAGERRMQLEQRQFMSMVSHEFRTPLAIIDSVAILLAEIPPASREEMAGHSEQILSATRRLARLVDNCLTDERLDQAAFSPQLETVSPSGLAREAAGIVTWPPSHRLVLQLGGLPETIECDPALVRIALSNLLDNAVKYSDGGTVTLSGSADDCSVKFSVADEGQGLSIGEVERIFERFIRGGGRNVAGAGLGLYVVRRIARLHGGDVAVRNSPGGAVFEFEVWRGASGADC